MKEGATTHTHPAVQTANRIDLRAAASSDALESRLESAFTELSRLLGTGGAVNVVWPSEASAARAAGFLKMPMAMYLLQILHNTTGSVILHARSVGPEFMRETPTDQLSFVFHLNSEEAAMRWERHDASPARRLAVASGLRANGWQVGVFIGPIRTHSDWRDDYGDIATRAGKAGFVDISVSFKGECLMTATSEGEGELMSGVEPILGERPSVVTLAARTKIRAYLRECGAKGARLSCQSSGRKQLPRNARTYGVREVSQAQFFRS